MGVGVIETLGVSERFACRVIGQPRSTQRAEPKTADDEAALTADIIELALQLQFCRSSESIRNHDSGPDKWRRVC